MFNVIDPQRKSDIVKQTILDLLLREKLLPGEKLPSETEMAEKFNVSRVTMREAIKELTTMGLLCIRRGEGTFVEKISPESYMAPLLPMLLLNHKDIDKIYEVRLYIEMGNAYLAAQNRTDAQLAELEMIHKKVVAESSMQFSKEAETILAFHNQIAKMSGNKILYQIYKVLNYIMVKGMEQTSATKLSQETTEKEHRQILELIRDRDASGAEQAIRQHILNVKRNYNTISKGDE